MSHNDFHKAQLQINSEADKYEPMAWTQSGRVVLFLLTFLLTKFGSYKNNDQVKHEQSLLFMMVRVTAQYSHPLVLKSILKI